MRRSSSPASTSTRRRSRGSPRSRASPRRTTSTASSRRGGRSPPASTSPTTSSSGRATTGTSGSCRTSCSASGTTAATTSTRTSTRACTASAARPSRPRRSSSTASAQSTTSSPSGSRSGTGSSACRRTRSGCSRSTRSGRTSSSPRSVRTRRRGSSPGGLQDFSISRAGQPWGIPIPWDTEQVAYVWADALVNYLSALTYARPGEDLIPTFWPQVRHLLAKDILRFHCVYWPALLLAAGYDVPKQLFVHGYLLLDDRKISKSLGNVVDPLELIDVYGADAVRFWCARSVSFGHDGVASVDGLRERYERELGNDLGNLLSRVTAMIARYRGGALAAVSGGRLACRRPARAARQRRGRGSRRVRPDGRARAHLGGRAGPQQARRGDGAVAAREGRRASRRSSTASSTTSSTVCGPSRSRWPPICPARPSASSRRWGSRPALAWDEVAYGRTQPVDGLEAAPPLFPRVDEPATAA